jgi:hypothetical protein
MKDSGSSPEVEQALIPSQGYDPFGVERRRREVARLRYTRYLTEDKIRDELSKLTPPITASIATVSRDLHHIRKKFRLHLSNSGFDAADEVYKRLAGYEEKEELCMELARATKDARERSHLIRTALQAARDAITLLQEIGLLDRTLGTVIVEDGRKAERVPTGSELQRRFNEITVTDADITSEAELAYRYGDAAASLDAAKAAKDSARDGEVVEDRLGGS